MDIQRNDLKDKKQRRRMLSVGIGTSALIGLGVAMAGLKPALPAIDRAEVWLGTVSRGDLVREIRAPGVLVPKESRWIAASAPARVEHIAIKPGTRVAAGTVILELSNPELAEQQWAAEAALAAAEGDYAAQRMNLESQLLDQRAQLASTKAEYELARLQSEAEKELAAEGVIPRIHYRRSQLVTEQLKAKVLIESARVTKLEQSLAVQEHPNQVRIEQLKRTAQLRRQQVEGLKVTAGIAGVLQEVPVEEGEQVDSGTRLARVAVPENLIAELRVPETQAKDVALEQPVTIDTRNGVIAGSVERIDPAVQDGIVLVDVALTDALVPGARPDLSIDGTIQIEQMPGVIYVERPAFAQPGSEQQVFRVDPVTDIAERLPVRFGRSSVNRIEVEQGLKVGDRIILSDTSRWDEYPVLRLK